MPSPPSTRPSDARGRRSSAFVRERHAPIDARSRPALSRSAGCAKTTTLEALVARSGLAAIAFVTMLWQRPDEATRNRILVQNPEALYGFGKSA
jgi:hypothetical protein